MSKEREVFYAIYDPRDNAIPMANSGMVAVFANKKDATRTLSVSNEAEYKSYIVIKVLISHADVADVEMQKLKR